MHRNIGRTAVALASGFALLATASAAQAKTKTVDVGTPPAFSKQLGALTSDANAFFPRTISVNVGDSVTFAPLGFHTVGFPKKGGGPLPLITPTGTKVAGAVDAAGAPFWFNGQDQLGFNSKLLKSSWGKKLSYTGSKAINSGLPFSEKVKPLTVKFTKTGTFTYHCDVHPGMTGTVRVRAAGDTVPTQKADDKRVTAQGKAAVVTAKKLARVTAPTGVVDLGVGGAGGVERFAFVPDAQTVPVGTTLTFRMSAPSREAHTATSGPGNIMDPSSYIGGLATGFEQPVIPAIDTYPSEPPGTVGGLTPTLHGNAFWNSGVLDANASPLPATATVRFDAPGVYPFYCLIHPFMKTTITVQ